MLRLRHRVTAPITEGRLRPFDRRRRQRVDHNKSLQWRGARGKAARESFLASLKAAVPRRAAREEKPTARKPAAKGAPPARTQRRRAPPPAGAGRESRNGPRKFRAPSATKPSSRGAWRATAGR